MTGCDVCGGEHNDVYYAPIVDGRAQWYRGNRIPCPACLLTLIGTNHE